MRMIVGSILAIAALTSGVGAKGPATGEAWQVGRALTPGVCEANGAGTKDIRFALVVMGSDFELGLWEGKDLPKADGRYPVTLSLDDDAPVHMLASAKGGLFEISLGRGELMDAVVHAKEMTVSLAGHSYRLRLAGAAAALDRAARCAGKPTLAEEHELPPVPIPDGGAWGLYETLPTATGRVCIPAIKDGEVSTTFLHDKPDRLFLIWKNMKWDFPAQTLDLHMSIDGGPDIGSGTYGKGTPFRDDNRCRPDPAIAPS